MWSLILYVVCMYACMCMYVVFCKIDHCIHIHWCIVMGLGHNDPWVESHMWPQQTWGQRSSRGQWPLVQVFGKKGQCILILWCFFKSNITIIAKVCDRESRRDTWFENRLVNTWSPNKPWNIWLISTPVSSLNLTPASFPQAPLHHVVGFCLVSKTGFLNKSFFWNSIGLNEANFFFLNLGNIFLIKNGKFHNWKVYHFEDVKENVPGYDYHSNHN